MDHTPAIDADRQTAEALARYLWSEVRRLVRAYGRQRQRLLNGVRQALSVASPVLAETFTQAQLAAWLEAARQAATPLRLPKLPDRGGQAENPGRTGADRQTGQPVVRPAVRFPQIEIAAKWVRDRIPFSDQEYRDLDQQAKAVGFTVAGAVTDDVARAVRDALAEDVQHGGTLRDFRRRVEEAVGTSAGGPGLLENVYRTTVGRAYSAGQIATLEHPLVRDEFPYYLYTATHDSRVEREHLEMERYGLDGTAVYRADDPIWDLFYPPWRWNCRCLVVPLSLEDAADRGVKEAIRWRRTGEPPAVPEFVKWPPFRPPPGWVPTGRALSPFAV